MLKKIISIENIGKFRSCKPRGDVEFRTLNLIYAENGRGKTTLCDVLKSLRSGEEGYIRGRKTLGQDDEPSVEIRLEEGNVSFKDGTWTKTLPQLAIFDTAFVHDNVHAGEFVGYDQKRNMYGVVVGAEGVKLQRRVDELDATSRETARRVREAGLAVEGFVPEGIKLQDFVAFEPVDGLEETLAEKKAELSALERAAEVSAKPALSELVLPSLPDNFVEILSRSIEDVSTDTEQRVRTHLAEHTAGAKEGWLSRGVEYQKGDECPYCGQSTEGIDLVSAYGKFFGNAYRELQSAVGALEVSVAALDSEATRLSLSRVVEQNESRNEFWLGLVDYEAPSLSLGDVVSALTKVRRAAASLVLKKKAALLEAVGLDEGFEAAKACFAEARAKVGAYNASCSRANAVISAKKTATEAGDATVVRSEVARLLAVKKRFEPKVSAICQEYLAANTAKRQVEGEKQEAKEKLDSHSWAIFPKFQKRINQLLSQFGAGFRIRDVEGSYLGGKASSNYQLVINEIPVELGDSSSPLDSASFRNTLSSGDRSTLALAFFIVQAELDPNLSERVLVFDDPFTSQDSSRRTCTQQRIFRLVKKAKQVFVLSHETSFLRLIYDGVPSATVKTLQFVRVGPDETMLAEWDVVDATRTNYHKDFVVLLRYANEGEGEPRFVARTIRPLLEAFLRTVFPQAFGDAEWLGDFIKKIREAGEGDRLSEMKPELDELEDINDYSKRYLHSTNPGADTEPIDSGELLGYVKRTLDVVGAPPTAGVLPVKS